MNPKLLTCAVAFLTFARMAGVPAASLDTVVLDIPVQSSARSASDLSYVTDDEGNVSGPADFAISGHAVYLLNTAQNCILRYQDGVLSDTIPLNGVHATHIAQDGTSLYLISSDLGLYRCSETGELTDLSDLSGAFDETITGFQAADGLGFLTTPDGVHGTTYEFELPITQSADVTQTMRAVEGIRFDTDIYYYYDEGDPDQTFSKEAVLTVYNQATGAQDTIEISSDSYLGAIQYLGRSAENHVVIRLEEITQDADYKIKTAQRIWILSGDADHTLLAVRDVEPQELYINEPFRFYDGAIYQLNTARARVQVLKIASDLAPNGGID